MWSRLVHAGEPPFTREVDSKYATNDTASWSDHRALVRTDKHVLCSGARESREIRTNRCLHFLLFNSTRIPSRIPVNPICRSVTLVLSRCLLALRRVINHRLSPMAATTITLFLLAIATLCLGSANAWETVFYHAGPNCMRVQVRAHLFRCGHPW